MDRSRYRKGRDMAKKRGFNESKTEGLSHVDLIRNIKDKLPCFFFNFSRKSCQGDSVELADSGIFEMNPEVTAFVRKRLAYLPPEISNLKSTRILRKTLSYGIGFHHAGLIPAIKEIVEELFGKGLIKVLYTTETFAVGINMPAKTVCFKGMRKFDGISFRFLNSKEFFQISGRAGRRGIDKEGFVYPMIERRDFNYGQIKKITDCDKDPIKSQFRLSVNTVLNIVKRHNDAEIEKILCMNFYTYQKYGSKLYMAKKDVIFRSFNNIRKRLVKMGYIIDGKLSEKGEFSSKVYADEILMGEIFATDFYKSLDEFQILMIIACLSYEPRPTTRFYEMYPSESVAGLKRIINRDSYLSKEKKFRNIDNLSALIVPCHEGESIFEIIKNTNLLEGDVIRIFRQMLDRIGQILNSAQDEKLIHILKKCQYVIDESMKDIDIV